jgi:16S rRNA (cytidine1402-2'-O)-methyltransferase
VTRGSLYVVATPLGNLGDLSPRALDTLRRVALVACEDTRRTGALLRSSGITTPLTSFFEHNERFKGEAILEALRKGKDVALVSDAGTPGISDPGYRLVRDARAAGLPVLPVPGPSAVVAALSVSGLPTDRFLFVGFLPPRARARQAAIAELREVRATLVLYESPLRVVACLADLAEGLGDREAFLCREATKLHEEYRRGRLSELRESLAGRDVVRGEIVLVVAGASPEPRAQQTGEPSEPVATFVARRVKAGLTRREAAKEAARLYGLSAREAYALALPREEG